VNANKAFRAARGTVRGTARGKQKRKKN
jgi:hypothetical protein